MSANELEINFSYASWTPNTRFKLCNVTWDMGYRDIVRFENEAKQREYFNALPGVDFDNCTMSKFGLPVRLRLPFAQACQYNYLIAYNDYDFDTPKYWYYFIQECEYINAYTTQLRIQLDVWQSFQFAVQFGRCYVERGHIGVANEHQMDNYGRDYLDIAEGLDCGADMRIVGSQFKRYMDAGEIRVIDDTHSQVIREPDIGYIIISTVDLVQDAGSVNNPRLVTAVGSIVDNIDDGANVYYTEKLTAVMLTLSQYPWVSQGIIGVWAVPKMTQIGQPGVTVNDYMIDFWRNVLNKDGTKHIAQVVRSVIDKTFISVDNFRNRFNIPQRYRNLKKFQLFPYSGVEVTMQNGNSIFLKPQYIDGNNLDIHMLARLAPPQPRMYFYADNYNGGEQLCNAIGLVDFPKINVVNNTSMMYLASNAHTIQYNQSSADWSQSKTLMGANNAYNQSQISADTATQQAQLANSNRTAMQGIANNLSKENLNIQTDNIQFQHDQTQKNALINMGIGVLTSAAGGNYGGMIGAVGGAAIDLMNNDASAANSLSTATRSYTANLSAANAGVSQQNAYNMQSTGVANAQTLRFADMNKSLATATAQGDYANTIAGINAKIQDSKLSAPNISAAAGGDATLLGDGYAAVWVRYKRIPDSAMKNIGEFWLRYGYYIQRFMQLPDNLMCMTNFTYWKLHEFYLRSSTCPEEYRLTIKGIFEKGVTVWNDPAKIGVTDYTDNDPLPGISY